MLRHGRSGHSAAEGIASDWLPTFAAVAVPEPQGWALMIAGFGLAGALVRRRAIA